MKESAKQHKMKGDQYLYATRKDWVCLSDTEKNTFMQYYRLLPRHEWSATPRELNIVQTEAGKLYNQLRHIYEEVKWKGDF